jgi:hypothetical protein
MNAYQAQRIRFGILAARHLLARDQITPDQVDYLEGCETTGWRIWDAGVRKAFDREADRLAQALKARPGRAHHG